MFRFSKDQQVMNIGGVRIGGQPGEYPTALAGTIFYHGQAMVKDPEKGIFDRRFAEDLIRRQSELSDETGNPAIVHIFARSIEAFSRYLDFVEACWDGPIIADSSEAETRAGIVELLSEIGYADLAIYNSLGAATTPAEAEALLNGDLDSAILLAYNPVRSDPEGSLDLLENGGGIKDKGLIPFAREAGLINLLIDPGVVPLGSGAGRALRFTVMAKARLGLPVGSGMHNAVSSWHWLKGRERTARHCCDAASAALQQLAGGDYLLYGPIERAETVFPVAAMADIMVAEAVRDLDVVSTEDHPIHRLV